MKSIIPYTQKDIRTVERTLRNLNSELLMKKGATKALAHFHFAAVRVPAYKSFLKTHRVQHEKIRTVGRRKSASARVRISEGSGIVTVNGKPLAEYLPYAEWQEIVLAPLKALSKEKNTDVSAKVSGGGKKGQATATQLGIARALILWNEDFKKTLKSLGMLTRDARVKERKKPGLKKARRAPQWSKR